MTVYRAGIATKYRAIRTMVVMPDRTIKSFPSKKEAKRYQDLLLLQESGRIRNLELQVPLQITVNGQKVCKYLCDFVYEEYAHGEWTKVWNDAKGMQTPVYRLKKRLVKAALGITITET